MDWSYYDYILYGYDVMCVAITFVVFILILHPTDLLILDSIKENNKNEDNNN